MLWLLVWWYKKVLDCWQRTVVFINFAGNLLPLMNETVMPEKLFTKSAFKIALECPRKLYYYRNPDKYTNADAEDEFLEALAEGGFQVGELAKIYCDVPPENDVKEKDYAGSLARTQELMHQQHVNIAEAAFRFGNLFVRVDILRRDGHVIDLIEVKAKSWDPNEDTFEGSRPKGSVQSGIRPYVYDVAFQKYVVTQALKELYPDETFTVRARLMMADKSKTADINGLNQLFKIKKVGNRAEVERADNIDQVLAKSQVQVLKAFDVDGLCDRVIAGTTREQGKNGFMLNMKFVKFVEAMSKSYCSNVRFPVISLGSKCFKCQFHNDGNDGNGGKQDGFKECWKSAAKFTDSDFNEPLVKDLWAESMGTKRDEWTKAGIFKMADITEKMLSRHANDKKPGLDHNERKWLQIAMATGNKDLLADYASDILDCGAYLDVEALRQEMEKWRFPLHMIDFETTAVALPYYVGMRPYEQVAFQFSHHIIEKAADGGYTIRHAGQYLNEDVSKFPNFDFVRALREELGHDEGTIFRYAAHENSILRAIYKQLEESAEPDKQVLMDFIDEITHLKDKKTHEMLHQGKRDMVDLLEVVKRYFYEPREMGGSNSIKVVLPAVLNASQFLKDKYSKPIYGKTIPSCNIPASDSIAWIKFDATGHVENPYHLLPSVSQLLDLEGINDDMLEREDDDMTIANGGAALTAYNKLMFCDGNMTDALREALLRYCELDTMAMVFIWEFFNQHV